MNNYYLVYSSKHPAGVVIFGRELLTIYISTLNHAERQACVRLEFEEDYLPSVLSLANCGVLK